MPTTISPNMGLIVPTTGQEPGPAWANDINSDLGILDQHTHSAGQGVPVPTAGININADLTFNAFNATNLNSVIFKALSLALAGTSPYLGCIYVAGADLYYNDTAGNQVRITSGGAVNATSSGISSGTATAAFSGGILVVDSNTNTPANIKAASYLMGDGTTDGFFVTLQPPVLAGSYSLTMPPIPGSTSILTLDTSGNISTTMTSGAANVVGTNMTSTGANAVANARTRTTGSTVGAGGVAIASLGSDSPSGSFTISTTITITTTGRPIFVGLCSDPTGTASAAYFSHGTITGTVFIQNTTGSYNPVRYSLYQSNTTGGQEFFTQRPVSEIWGLDSAGAGTYTYQVGFTSSSGNLSYLNLFLIAYEL